MELMFAPQIIAQTRTAFSFVPRMIEKVDSPAYFYVPQERRY
jgi:hypothetical protein